MNPANRGTATHKFMEFFDYSAESFDVDAQIERMVAEHHLTEDEAKILECDKLKKFFKNDIATRIKNSPLLLREKKLPSEFVPAIYIPTLPKILLMKLSLFRATSTALLKRTADWL